MTEERIRDLEQQFIVNYKKSYLKRYDQWKRKDLLLVALQTMPKQVKTEKVIDNLMKLKLEFGKRLGNEE